MEYGLLASIVMYLHFLWILLVILPVPVIIVGGLYGWRFVRNPWFRIIHMCMMGLVLLFALIQIECPLTSLEKYLQRNARLSSYEGGFIHQWVKKLLFYDFSLEFFLLMYLLFFLVILALLFMVKPDWRKPKI